MPASCGSLVESGSVVKQESQRNGYGVEGKAERGPNQETLVHETSLYIK